MAETFLWPAIFRNIKFNSNILETNVLNIAVLICGTYYVMRRSLVPVLERRQHRIITSLHEAEEKVQEATARFTESTKITAHTKILVDQLKNNSEFVAKRVKETILMQGKLEIERLTNVGKSTVKATEFLVQRQIQKQIAIVAFKKAVPLLTASMNFERQSKCIDLGIAQLESLL
uniref:ATP synthase CF0 subunit I n=1 Tax=Cryptomonas sp. CCAC 1634B TaxID=2051848 RepID=A0A679CAU8_9CRYP|nr:ATP synthase CF0 subunit I [Cryptomonas sp. CCAC 1634B]